MAGTNVPHINTNVSHQHPTNGSAMGYVIPGRQRSGTTNSQASSSRVDPISATTSYRPGQDLVGSYSSSTIGAAIPGGASAAGFGVMHRSETPEPWERRITDDGMAYYYFNTITEDSQWTRPEPHEGYPAQYGGRTSQQQGNYGTTPYGQTQYQQKSGAPTHGRNRTDSEASYSGRERDTRRASVYSDDSEVSPLGKEARQGLHHDSMNTTGIANVRPWPTPGRKPEDATSGTQANGVANPLQVAQNLQAQMIPPPLPPLTLYSDKARDAIGAVVEAYVDNNATTNDSTASGSVTSASTPDVSYPSSTSLEQGQPQASSESAEHTSIEAVRMQTMADRVALVVVAVRNLLYVSGTLTGSLPNLGGTSLSNGHHGIHRQGANAGGLNGVGLNGIGAGLAEDADWVRQEIKPYQRKVTATLSKLVLSARAVNANPDWPVGGGRAGSSSRVESDAAELERAVTTFVYQIQRTAASSRAKRLQGVMLPGDGSAGIGVGLIGGGVGGNWKGAGFVPIGDSALGAPAGGPEIRLGREVVSELAGLRVLTEEKMSALRTAIEGYKSALAVVTGESTSTGTYDSRAADLVILNGRLVVAQITDFLLHAEDVDISMAVDVMGTEDDDEAYLAGVKRARELIRTFETAKQALYDDGSVLLMASQAIHVSTLGTSTLTNSIPNSRTGGPADVLLQTAIPAIQSNLGTVMETLELLLDIAHEQAVVQGQREPPIGYQDDMHYQYNDGDRQYQRDPMYPDGTPYSGDVDEMLGKMGIRSTRGDAHDETDMVDIGDALARRGESRPPNGQRHAYVKGDIGPGARDSIDGGVAASEITFTIGNSSVATRAPSSIAPSLQESTTVVSNGSTTGDIGDDSDSDDLLTGKPSKSLSLRFPLSLFDTNPCFRAKTWYFQS
jgi:son of sevenless